MKKFNKESGQALVVVALSGMVLLGFMALATDAGVLLHSRKQMQSAADSAALAGAYELTLTGTYSSARTAGLADAANNGFSVASNCPATPNTSGPTVCIKEPTNDSNANFNNPGYVEADISAPTPTPFINAFWTWFNPGYTPMTVAARAVAVSQSGAGPSSCINVMDRTAQGAMTLQGNFNVDAPHCPVLIDSNSSDALQFTGGAGTLTAGSVNVVGGDGGHPTDSHPIPTTGAPVFTDPMQFRDLAAEMAHLTPNDPNGTLSCSNYTGTAPTFTTLTPEVGQKDTVKDPGGNFGSAFGTYSAVCYSGTVNISNVTLPAGVYFFTGTVTISGLPAATTGVTFVMANGSSLNVWPGAQENVTVSAPPLDTTTTTDFNLWNGIIIYQPNSNTANIQIQKGSSNLTMNGIIYAPTASLTLQDGGGNHNGGVNLNTNLIVGTLSDTSADLTMTCYTCGQEGSGGGVFSRVTLVE